MDDNTPLSAAELLELNRDIQGSPTVRLLAANNLGLYATLFSVGYASGPLILGLAGSDGWMPFVLAAALFAAGLVPVGLLQRVQGRLMSTESGHGHRLGPHRRAEPLPRMACRPDQPRTSRGLRGAAPGHPPRVRPRTDPAHVPDDLQPE